MGIETVHSFSNSGLSKQIDLFKGRVESRLKLGLRQRAFHYGLRRDLTVEIERPAAKIPISVRRMQDGDLEILLPSNTSHLTPEERLEMTWRKSFARKVGTGGYVAIDERDGSFCYMQWMLDPSQHEVIASLGSFPVLNKGEALLENAYTPPSHRGLGVMSAAMTLIAERAADVGARYVITFVGDENIASLKGCRRAGFAPYMTHTRQHYLFGLIRRDRFEQLPQDDPRRDWQL